MQDVLEALKAARGRIEKGWLQHGFAVDEFGEGCHEDSDRAVAWCTYGAINASCSTVHLAGQACDTLRTVLGFTALAAWNDDEDRTKDEVLAAFDRAIELAAKGPADL